MPKVKLEKVYIGNRESVYIKAPDFCPYREHIIVVSENPDKSEKFSNSEYSGPIVDPKLCPLCKICTFVPESHAIDSEELTKDENKMIADFLSSDKDLGVSISGQMQYLAKERRMVIAMLISGDTLDRALSIVAHKERAEKLRKYFLYNQTPVCYIAGAPVYFNSKLTQSPVQVVGEVKWKT